MYLHSNWLFNGIDNSVEEFDKEKFAELIVNECRVTMSENFHECRTASLMDKKIKEHFGVE